VRVAATVIGIDLSGPANTADTCLVAFERHADRLVFLEADQGPDDERILELVSACALEVVVGLDATLPIQPLCLELQP
jgi:hypothetical protein